MNLEQIKVQLKRIDNHVDFLQKNRSAVSVLDRDVLLEHIRELYNTCLEEPKDQNTAVVSQKEIQKQQRESSKKKSPLIFTHKESPEKKKMVFTTTSRKEEQKLETKTVLNKSKVVLPEKKPEEIKKPIETLIESNVEKKLEKDPKNKNNVAQIIPKPVSVEKKVSTEVFNPEFEELFIFKVATDLSQKLSESPIANLNHALGLNQKFLYINELFSGDVNSFKKAVDYLNSTTNFDTARVYIEEKLLEKYQWLDKARKMVAKDFIKLVRRRHLSK